MAKLYTEYLGHNDITPDFGTIVRGNYMKPVLHSGDLCFVVADSLNIDLHKGGIGVFQVGLSNSPKLAYINDVKNGTCYTNDAYGKREYPVETFVGIVVGFQRMFRCKLVY